LTVDGTVGVSGTVTVDSELTTKDFDSGAGTDTTAVTGLVVPASGGSVAITGDAANGLDVDVTRVSGNVTVVQGTATNLKVDASGVAVPVTDNGGSLTVDGTVSITANSSINNAQVGGSNVATAAAGIQKVGIVGATGTALDSTAGVLDANNKNVNGAAVVTSVTGVQDVMPRKRTGSTGLSPNYAAFHITTKTTTNVTASTCYVQVVVVNCSNAGTAATITLQNKEATAKILYSATLAVSTTTPVNVSEPILCTSGLDIVTAGTTMGVADVFVTYWQ
jgi:hypothetical protein